MLTPTWTLLLGVATGGAGLPEVTVPACPAAPVVDGRLDDVGWKTAARLGAFVPFKGDHKTTNTTVASEYAILE